MFRKKVWILGLLFLVWMICSTTVITNVVNRGINIEKMDAMLGDNQKDIYYWIDDFTISDNIWNTVSVYGWLVGLPEQKGEKKVVSIIFQSDKDIYKVEAETIRNWPVFEGLQTKLALLDDNVGFGRSFSPLKFNNGIYQMFLYCAEENGSAGIIETNHFIEKSAKGVSKCENVSKEIPKPELLEDNNAQGYGWVDTVVQDSAHLKIEAWGFLDGMNSVCQDVIVGVKDRAGQERYFEAFPFGRFDLVGYKGNTKCQNAGISAILNVGNEPIQEKDITIYVVNEGKWFSFQPDVKIQYQEQE